MTASLHAFMLLYSVLFKDKGTRITPQSTGAGHIREAHQAEGSGAGAGAAHAAKPPTTLSSQG